MIVMLNMLLAIVLDTYLEVKSDIGDAETLWSQVPSGERQVSVDAGNRCSLFTGGWARRCFR